METIFSKGPEPVKNFIAFFDLDGTVINANSGKVLIQFAYKKGLISKLALLKGTYLSLLYKFDLKDAVKIIRSLSGWLKGVSESSLKELSSEIFIKSLQASIRSEIRDRINYHKSDGGKVVLLSSALLPLCSEVADHLNMDDVICSELELKNGVYTGNPSGKFCFGNEKVIRLREYCKSHNTDPGQAWYYGDSIDDLPVLSSVGNPVCVSPDKKLSSEALRRGWKVLYPENY